MHDYFAFLNRLLVDRTAEQWIHALRFEDNKSQVASLNNKYLVSNRSRNEQSEEDLPLKLFIVARHKVLAVFPMY